MHRRALSTIAALALLHVACKTTFFYPWRNPPEEFRIIAYVFGDRADYNRIGAHKLTHINYAFGLVNEAGEIYFQNPNAPSHLAQLQALKSRNPDLKVIVSVGGWGADNFSDAALTPESRDKFARSAVELVKRYALDGIDLDWEYPGQPGPGIKYRPEDKQNFTLMLKTLREHLDALSNERARTGDDRLTLSIASSAGNYFWHTEMDRLHVYLDWINIMTYDFAGNWSKITGHHTALYWSAANPQPWVSSVSFVQQHLDAGIPSHKLVLGAAFYGKGWTGVERFNNGLYQPAAGYLEGVRLSYSNIAREYVNQRGFRRHWDADARAPYLWNAETGTFITYDDPVSLRQKAEFVKRHSLGGVMYWEYSHDPDEVLLDSLYQNLR